MVAGYSGTPLPKKLGVKPGTTILTITAPKDYAGLLGPLPDGARITARVPAGGAPLVHLFVRDLAELEAGLPKARKAMTVDGAIWVSWYKQAAKIPTDVTEGSVRGLALRATW